MKRFDWVHGRQFAAKGWYHRMLRGPAWRAEVLAWTDLYNCVAGTTGKKRGHPWQIRPGTTFYSAPKMNRFGLLTCNLPISRARSKSVTIPIHQFADSIEHGTWFDGSSIEGFARIAESDMYLKPDISTFQVIPWERGENTTARVICQVFT
jgi:hypothetical protein